MGLIIDLGHLPVSNRFLGNIHEIIPKYPFKLILNNKTGHLSLEETFPIEDIKPRYEWLTCYEPEDHLDELVEKIIKLPSIDKDSVFAGYSFKDDSTLERLKTKGCLKQWRINSKIDLGINDPCAGIETFQSAFTIEKAKQIRNNYNYADIIIVRHVVEHAYNLSIFIKAITTLVRTNGYIVWELPDCERALNEGDCTTLWEEHAHYFTNSTFKELLLQSGFSIIDYYSALYPLENSIIAIVKKIDIAKKMVVQDNDNVKKEEYRANIFFDKILQRKKTIRSKLKSFREKYGGISIFGAGHLTVVFLSIMEIEDLIDFVIDDDPNKKGLIMPVGNIRIVSAESLYLKNIHLCLLGLNPKNHNSIISKHSKFSDEGGLFVSLFPGTNLYLEDII